MPSLVKSATTYTTLVAITHALLLSESVSLLHLGPRSGPGIVALVCTWYYACCCPTCPAESLHCRPHGEEPCPQGSSEETAARGYMSPPKLHLQ